MSTTSAPVLIERSGAPDRIGAEGASRTRTIAYRVAIALTCVALAVIAYATRDGPLGTPSLHIDDAWVLLGWKAHRFVDLRRAGSTSLGFVLLLRGWLDAVGFTYRHAQTLPLVASALGAPMFLLVALRMRIRYPAALLGAAMLLASPTVVSYATRVKQYSSEVLLAIALLGAAAAIVRKPESTRAWGLFAAVAVVAMAVSFVLAAIVASGVIVGSVARMRSGGWHGLAREWRTVPSLCVAVIAGFAAAWYLLVVRLAISPALRAYWSGYYLSEARGVPNRAPFWHPIDTAHDGVLAHDWRLVQSLFRFAFTGPATVWIVVFVVASVVVAIGRPMHALLFGTPVVLVVIGSAAQVAPLGGGRVDVWLYAPITFMIVSAVDVVLARVGRRHWRDVATVTGVVAVAVLLVASIPEPEVFTWPDIVPLVHQLERERSPSDLVVVSGALMFNYALSAPQPFVTEVSDRNATHFAPIVQGVRVMNWTEYPAPMTEFRARLGDVRDVWLLDSPTIIYPLGAAPRELLKQRGFSLVTTRESGAAALEHWRRAA